MITLNRIQEVLPEAFDHEVALPSTTEIPAEVTGRALEIWVKPAAEDASKRDFLFVLELLRRNVPESRARELLALLPGGKMLRDGRGDDYWTATLRSVKKIWDEEKAIISKAMTLKPEEAMLPSSIEALSEAERVDPNAYEAAIAKLKTAGVRLRPLEAKVRAATQTRLAKELSAGARFVKDGNSAVGWFIRDGEKTWLRVSSDIFKMVLRGRGLSPDAITAEITDKPWTLTSVPFGPEELPGRKWNLGAAALVYELKAGPHPTWDLLFRALGRNLDGVIGGHPWCQKNEIKDGANYLLAWVAGLFQKPLTPLPYLFFYGEQQGTGKSLFHEALGSLMRPGYALANEALENTRGFNSEIAGAILCAADEVELGPRAHKRIKQWTTSQQILIHPKGQKAYQLPNTTHWIQTSNEIRDCPQLRGDTRITSVLVERWDDLALLPKDEMLAKLGVEAPAFLYEVLNLKLPPIYQRLSVPALDTQEKMQQQKASSTELQTWCDEHPDYQFMTDSEFTTKFLASLPSQVSHEWTAKRVLFEEPVTGRRFRQFFQSVTALIDGGVGGDRGVWRGSTKDLFEAVPVTIRQSFHSMESFGLYVRKAASFLAAKPIRTRTIRGWELRRGR